MSSRCTGLERIAGIGVGPPRSTAAMTRRSMKPKDMPGAVSTRSGQRPSRPPAPRVAGLDTVRGPPGAPRCWTTCASSWRSASPSSCSTCTHSARSDVGAWRSRARHRVIELSCRIVYGIREVPERRLVRDVRSSVWPEPRDELIVDCTPGDLAGGAMPAPCRATAPPAQLCRVGARSGRPDPTGSGLWSGARLLVFVDAFGVDGADTAPGPAQVR
jgi:hypothetical protein